MKKEKRQYHIKYNIMQQNTIEIEVLSYRSYSFHLIWILTLVCISWWNFKKKYSILINYLKDWLIFFKATAVASNRRDGCCPICSEKLKIKWEKKTNHKTILMFGLPCRLSIQNCELKNTINVAKYHKIKNVCYNGVICMSCLVWSQAGLLHF